jgi:hypothetical protein
MGAQARTRAEQLAWPGVAGRMADLYEQIA